MPASNAPINLSVAEADAFVIVKLGNYASVSVSGILNNKSVNSTTQITAPTITASTILNTPSINGLSTKKLTPHVQTLNTLSTTQIKKILQNAGSVNSTQQHVQNISKDYSTVIYKQNAKILSIIRNKKDILIQKDFTKTILKHRKDIISQVKKLPNVQKDYGSVIYKQNAKILSIIRNKKDILIQKDFTKTILKHRKDVLSQVKKLPYVQKDYGSVIYKQNANILNIIRNKKEILIQKDFTKDILKHKKDVLSQVKKLPTVQKNYSQDIASIKDSLNQLNTSTTMLASIRGITLVKDYAKMIIDQKRITIQICERMASKTNLQKNYSQDIALLKTKSKVYTGLKANLIILPKKSSSTTTNTNVSGKSTTLLSKDFRREIAGIKDTLQMVTGGITFDSKTLTNCNLSAITNVFPSSLVTLTGTQTITGKDFTSGNTFPSSLVTTSTSQILQYKNLTSSTNSFPSTLVDLNAVQTLQNKSFVACVFPATIIDTTTAQTLTNKNLTSATNTFPTSLATLTGTQILTNKTLDATCTISSTVSLPTTVLNTSNTATVTNKSFDTSCKFGYLSDLSHIEAYGGSAATFIDFHANTTYALDRDARIVAFATSSLTVDSSALKIQAASLTTPSTLIVGDLTITNNGGNYGSMNISGSGSNGYEGISINNQFVLFSKNDNTMAGLFSYSGGQWCLRYTTSGSTALFHSDVARISTTTTGCSVNGLMAATTASVGAVTLNGDSVTLGSLNISGGGANAWKGYVIESRTSFMDNGSSFGLYDITNSKWCLSHNRNADTILYYNGVQKLQTTSGGVTASGGLCITSMGSIVGGTNAMVDAYGNILKWSSSRRYKMNIQDISDAESENILDNTRCVKYTPNVETTVCCKGDENKFSYGIIAEELEKIDSRLVSYNLEGECESVQYLLIVPILLKELKKLKTRVEFLEKDKVHGNSKNKNV